jgi:hypothetical protein
MQGTYQVRTAENAKKPITCKYNLLLSCKQQIFDDSIENSHFLSTNHRNQSEAIPYPLHFPGQLYKEQFQQVEGAVALKASENWTFLSGIL